MYPSIFKAAVLALAFTDAAKATLQQYTLASGDDYTGTSFWDGFDFITTADPNFGFVSYQSRAVAESSQFGGPLIKTFSNGSNYMGVDYWNTYDTTAGRPSVRIETTKQYQYGLFVADLAHMPASVCGTWPAFWTVSHVDYPSQGEIDILENINEATQSLETLHTTANCSVVGNMLGAQQNASQNSYNCDDQATSSDYGSQSTYQGCSATNSDKNSYGSTFNAIGGGVYAMEWTNEAIQIWNFAPNDVPSNLKSGTPDTSTWGTPQFTTAQGSCDIDSHFKNQQVVFNTDFCGSYAGLTYFWEQTSCYKSNPTLYPDCNSYVAANPAMYEDAYWTINSLKVYQKTNVESSSSSSTHSSTTSTSSSTLKTSTASTTKGGEVKTSSSSSVPILSGTGISTYPSSSSSVRYSNTTTSAGPTVTPSVSYTTSTVYSTSTYTITSCAPTVTDCPAKLGQVTTEIISLYTTVCPVTATETSSGTVSSKPPYSPPTPPESVTSTVYTTKVYTITSCAATVTDCPAKLGQVTTEVVSLYTTVCPYTPEGTHPAYPTIPSSIIASSPVASPVAASSAGGIVSSPAVSAPAATPPTVVIVMTETIKPVSSVPVFSTISKISNNTIPVGTSGAPVVKTSTAGGVVSPSQSPIYSTSGASEVTARGAFAVVLAVLVLLI